MDTELFAAFISGSITSIFVLCLTNNILFALPMGIVVAAMVLK